MDDDKSDTRQPAGPVSHNPPNDDAYSSATRHRRPRPAGWAVYYRDRTLRRLFWAACLTLLAWFSVHRYVTSGYVSRDQDGRLLLSSSLTPASQGPIRPSLNATTKVPLEVHIMSKCPDAQDCLQQLVVPAMEKIHDKVDFLLSYIGSVDSHSDAVSCKHGPSECLGNMILLCAADLYPDPVISLGFANCLISSYQDIPDRDLVEGCALEHGIDFNKVNQCLSDEDDAIELLRHSVERSEENNVTTSCTIRLSGKVRCVRDGGKWKDCKDGSSVDDLVRDVENFYEEIKDQA